VEEGLVRGCHLSLKFLWGSEWRSATERCCGLSIRKLLHSELGPALVLNCLMCFLSFSPADLPMIGRARIGRWGCAWWLGGGSWGMRGLSSTGRGKREALATGRVDTCGIALPRREVVLLRFDALNVETEFSCRTHEEPTPSSPQHCEANTLLLLTVR